MIKNLKIDVSKSRLNNEPETGIKKINNEKIPTDKVFIIFTRISNLPLDLIKFADRVNDLPPGRINLSLDILGLLN